jgi:uncharacterized C2H2 Zn-finger protein
MNFLISALFIILIGFQSCSRNQLGIQERIFDTYIKEDNAIILSCTRCHCVIDFLKDYSRLSKNKIPIYTDTNCASTKEIKHFSFISQNAIDSIYERNYNILLVRKENEKLTSRLLKTEESNSFEKIIDEFFKK